MRCDEPILALHRPVERRGFPCFSNSEDRTVWKIMVRAFCPTGFHGGKRGKGRGGRCSGSAGCGTAVRTSVGRATAIRFRAPLMQTSAPTLSLGQKLPEPSEMPYFLFYYRRHHPACDIQPSSDRSPNRKVKASNIDRVSPHYHLAPVRLFKTNRNGHPKLQNDYLDPAPASCDYQLPACRLSSSSISAKLQRMSAA